MPSPISDMLVKRVRDKGWLSISTLFFDNTFNVNVFNSKGCVAISPTAELIFSVSPLDTQNSANVSHNFVTMIDNKDDPRQFGFQYGVTVVGFDCLQHFDNSLYTYGENLGDNKTGAYGYPKIPTPAQLEAMIKDPVTGLYPNTSTVSMDKDGERLYSAISLYDETKGLKWVGARVDAWKDFYADQKKFAAVIKAEFGLTDIL